MTDIDTRPWHQRAGRSRCMIDEGCANPPTRYLLIDYFEDGVMKVGHLWRCEPHWQEYASRAGAKALGGPGDLRPDPDYRWPDAA